MCFDGLCNPARIQRREMCRARPPVTRLGSIVFDYWDYQVCVLWTRFEGALALHQSSTWSTQVNGPFDYPTIHVHLRTCHNVYTCTCNTTLNETQHYRYIRHPPSRQYATFTVFYSIKPWLACSAFPTNRSLQMR
jgi:hypothetical protein